MKTVLEKLADDEDRKGIMTEIGALKAGDPKARREVRKAVGRKRKSLVETLSSSGIKEEDARNMVTEAEEVFIDEWEGSEMPNLILRAEAMDVFAKKMIERLNEDED